MFPKTSGLECGLIISTQYPEATGGRDIAKIDSEATEGRDIAKIDSEATEGRDIAKTDSEATEGRDIASKQKSKNKKKKKKAKEEKRKKKDIKKKKKKEEKKMSKKVTTEKSFEIKVTDDEDTIVVTQNDAQKLDTSDMDEVVVEQVVSKLGTLDDELIVVEPVVSREKLVKHKTVAMNLVVVHSDKIRLITENFKPCFEIDGIAFKPVKDFIGCIESEEYEFDVFVTRSHDWSINDFSETKEKEIKLGPREIHALQTNKNIINHLKQFDENFYVLFSIEQYHEEFKHLGYTETNITMPGGALNRNDSIKDCALRELWEETCIDSKKLAGKPLCALCTSRFCSARCKTNTLIKCHGTNPDINVDIHCVMVKVT
jgi:hypothetical protein